MSELIEAREPTTVVLEYGDACVVFRGESTKQEVILVGDYDDTELPPNSHIEATMVCILFSDRPEANAVRGRLMDIMLHRPDPDAEPVAGSS